MANAWSRGCLVKWHPAPRIYDRRSKLLELLDEEYGVLRYKVSDTKVAVVLGNSAEVSVGLDFMTFHSLLSGEAGSEADLVSAVADLLQAELQCSPRSARFAFQHLVPWEDADELTPSEGFRVGASSALALGDGYAVQDVAVLADITWPGHEEPFQAEYGVVEAEQAPLRVARILGRATGHRPTQHDLIMNRQYPRIATFVDSTWPVQLPENAVEWTRVLHDEFLLANDEAGRFADAAHQSLIAERSKKELQS